MNSKKQEGTILIIDDKINQFQVLISNELTRDMLMCKIIHILVADDHPIVRHGLTLLCATQPDLKVVAEAGNGTEVVHLAAQYAPDVVLLDLLMPGIDGLTALKLLRQQQPAIRILVLTSFADDAYVAAAFAADVNGFYLKDSNPLSNCKLRSGPTDKAQRVLLSHSAVHTNNNRRRPLPFSYALATLWQSWGVQPDLLIGHSVGELVAACVAGVFSLEDGLRLVAARGRLMGALPQDGEMLSVMAEEAVVRQAIAPYPTEVSIAAVNGPQSLVIAGKRETIFTIANQLAAEGVKTRRLIVSHAFHSPLMAPMLDDFRQVAQRITYHKPKLRIVSNVTGKVAGDEMLTPNYWVRHVREAVRFADGIATLGQEGASIFLEIGPKPTLLGMAEANYELRDHEESTLVTRNSKFVTPLMLPSLREEQSDWRQMLTSLGALYVHGVTIDWQGFDRDYPRQKVTLPTYPFERQRYWVDVAKPRQQSPLRPLIDKMTQSPFLKGRLFETAFTVDALPFLADHRVYGAVVSPGACQLAMVLNAAALTLRQEHGLQVDDVVWPQPFVIAAAQKYTVQALLRSEVVNDHDRHYSVQLVSFVADEMISSETSATIHLTGSVMASTSRPDAVVDLATLRQRCNQVLDVPAFYRHWAATQITLGPSFRWIQSLRCTQAQPDTSTGQEVLAQLTCPETIQISGHLLHPGLLDACFQVTGAGQAQDADSETLLPFALDSLHLHRAATGNHWWCHAIQVGQQRWDIQLLAENGEVVASLTGFSVRPASAEAIQGQEHWRNWLYTVAWEAQSLPNQPGPSRTQSLLAGQSWLVLADRQGLGRALADCLQQQEATVLLADADELASDDYGQLLAEASRKGNLSGVIHLWSLDAPSVEQAADLDTGSHLGCGTVLPLVQALVRQDGQPARLWLVTQGAQSVQPGDAVTGIAQSTLRGMGKVIALEYPELACTCLDLDGTVEQIEDSVAVANQPLAEVSAWSTQPPQEAQLAWRGAQRYVARLVRYPTTPLANPDLSANGSKPAIPQNLVIHEAASYLITGGLGGLGLEVAKWLAAQGAGHLVLMGRHRPTPTAQTQLDVLTAQGVTVTVAQANVTDQAQVEQILTQIDPVLPFAWHCACRRCPGRWGTAATKLGTFCQGIACQGAGNMASASSNQSFTKVLNGVATGL